MIDICLLGCGGVMPLPERALTSLFVGYNGRAMLIDCGEGTQTVLKRHKLKYSRIDAILLTHLHGDHICGLAGLLLTFGLMGRQEPLRIYGPVGTREIVSAVKVLAPNQPFEIIAVELSGDGAEICEIGIKIKAFAVKHSVTCLGYRLELARFPEFDASRARALGIPVSLWGALQRGESVPGFSPSDVLGPPRKGISVVYSTDTRPTDALISFGTGADLMILEGMYGDSEWDEKAIETSHMTMCEAADVARRCGAAALWLTHYSPSVTSVQEYEARVKEIFPSTSFGYDGMSCSLKFE